MSFKRFDPEDIVLSSELITFPTWYTQEEGDTSHLDMKNAVECPEQGFSVDYYTDYYSTYSSSGVSGSEDDSDSSSTGSDGGYDSEHSKALFSLAYAQRPENRIADFTPIISYVPYDSYSLVYSLYETKDDEGHYIVDPDLTYYTKDDDENYVEVPSPVVLDDDGEYYIEMYHYDDINSDLVYYTENEDGDYIPVPFPVASDSTKPYYTRVETYPTATPAEIVFGQYRSLVLGDEDSDFRFGNTRIEASGEAESSYADSFVALSVDRARFREKLDPNTCRINLMDGRVLAPDISANRRYLDAGRVFDIAERVVEGGVVSYHYPNLTGSSAATSYGYFLPDIGVFLFNTSNNAELFRTPDTGSEEDEGLFWKEDEEKVATFKDLIHSIDLRSQETVTSNFVFVRARNAEFNYSTNPSNISGSAGNIRHDVMINQPQSFITTVGLYNDSNDLLAVAKLSRPLIKDFTKEALIRIKLDY